MTDAAVRDGADWRAAAGRAGTALRARLARAAATARRLAIPLLELELTTRSQEAERLAEVAAALREAAAWRGRAARHEARIAELEGELAAARMVALDLRARLVCSTGKLATATATTRYNASAQALASRTAR